VWLIEDSATDVFVIKDVLRACAFEFELRVMSDGDSALSLLRSIEDNEHSEAPALVLLDLNVPKVHGIEVLSALRRAPRCSKAPVIVVTSSDSPSDLKAIYDIGVEAYFRKPHDLDEFMKLSEVIKRTLDKEHS
jgi:two-component system response regulator